MNTTPSPLRKIAAVAATAALALIGVVALPQAASAVPTTYPVDDLGDGGGATTLRGAILLANANDGVDTISINVPGTLTVSTSTILVTEGVIIQGFSTAVGNKITRDFNGDIFTVDILVGNPADERDFITRDLAMDGNTPATTGRAIQVLGAVQARNVGLYDSYFYGFKGSAYGGAVSVFNTTGNFVVDGTDFSNNQSVGSGGTVYLEDIGGAIDFSSMNMLSSLTTTGAGGNIYIFSSSSAVSVVDSEISGGTAPADGGGCINIFAAASFLLQDSSVVSCTSYNAGAGLYVSNVPTTTIVNSAVFQNEATNNVGGGAYFDGGEVLISDSTFSFNESSQSGGGIWADVDWLRMDGASVHDNTAQTGGGLELDEFADISYITNSNFYNNRARSDSPVGGLGGAISFSATTGAPFAITATTFENNDAVHLDGVGVPDNAGRGGAIYAVGTGDSFIIEDSLFTNNKLGGFPGTYGVSIYVDASDVADLFNIVNTTFDEPAESMVMFIQGFVTANAEFVVAHTTFVTDFAIAILDTNTLGPVPRVTHTIFDGAPGFQTVIVDLGPDVAVDWSLFGSSLAAQNVTATNSTFDVPSMKLGALQGNGGPTFTRMPLPGSPAIDRGNPAAIDLPAYDQREADFNRVINNIVDIGAVEAPHALPPTGATVNPVIPIGGGILLLLGIGAVILASRRRRTKSH